MNPIKTEDTNFTYLGPTLDIADLPCVVHGADTYSTWQLSDKDRDLIARGANIRLGIYGMRPIPPVSLQVVVDSGPWKRVDSPCKVCGKEPSDDSHGTIGTGSHAFKMAEPTFDEQQYVPKRFG